MDPKTKNAVGDAVEALSKLSGMDEDEPDEDRFEERLSDVMDVESSANQLLDTLKPLEEIDEKPAKHAQSIIEALSSAGTVEKEADLDLNLQDALAHAEQLKLALVAAKKSIKDADEDNFGAEEKSAAKEALSEAVSDLRSLIKDIKAI